MNEEKRDQNAERKAERDNPLWKPQEELTPEQQAAIRHIALGLTEGQRVHFRLRAGWMAGELSIREGLKYTKDQQAGWIAGQLEEACSIGYSIALTEVRSTPWEFLFQSVGPSANENEAEANKNASLGWEYLACDGRWMIWRRHKAVRDLATTTSDSSLGSPANLG